MQNRPPMWNLQLLFATAARHHRDCESNFADSRRAMRRLLAGRGLFQRADAHDRCDCIPDNCLQHVRNEKLKNASAQ